jgi:hypothetical protein
MAITADHMPITMTARDTTGVTTIGTTTPGNGMRGEGKARSNPGFFFVDR